MKSSQRSSQAAIRSELVVVMVACGEAHLQRAKRSIEYLRYFGLDRIKVITSSGHIPELQAEIVTVTLPEKYSEAEKSRLIKTNLLSYLPEEPQLYLYLDTDVMVVSPDFANVVEFFSPPITFTFDHHVRVGNFGKWGLTESNPYEYDLVRAFREYFGVIVDPEWRQRNGGVFLFDRSAAEFFECWYDLTKQAIKNEHWTTRDQPSMAAALWKLGLQDQPCFPEAYNWLVRHSGEPNSQLEFRGERFFFSGCQLHALHFVGGWGAVYGSCWEWDRVSDMLSR